MSVESGATSDGVNVVSKELVLHHALAVQVICPSGFSPFEPIRVRVRGT